jgi:hypothetical protein
MKSICVKTVLVVILAASVFACKKDNKEPVPDNVSAENKAKAAELQAYLQVNKFSLKNYYSDSAIDYVDTDQVVKAETNLWQYVSHWIKDDKYTFNSGGEVTIEQHGNKIKTDSSSIITRTYSVEPDENGVAFNFVGHEYQPLQYRLVTLSDTLLKLNAEWNGKTVVSEYKIVP